MSCFSQVNENKDFLYLGANRRRLETTRGSRCVTGLLLQKRVLKQIEKLKAQNRLRRVGLAKEGSWKVISPTR